jgi:hypothetical protein
MYWNVWMKTTTILIMDDNHQTHYWYVAFGETQELPHLPCIGWRDGLIGARTLAVIIMV